MTDTWEAFSHSEPVAMVYQHDNTSCWAAGIAMLAGTDLDTVLGQYRDVAMTWDRIEPIALNWGVREVYPTCALPPHWASELAEHGPLWIVIKQSALGGVSHAVVLYGAWSDGTAANTWMYYNDPIHGPLQLDFDTFERSFELGANSRATILATR